MNTTVKVVGIRRLLGHEEEHKIGVLALIGSFYYYLGEKRAKKYFIVKQRICNKTLVLFDSLVSATFRGGSLAEIDFFTLSMYLSISAISYKRIDK